MESLGVLQGRALSAQLLHLFNYTQVTEFESLQHIIGYPQMNLTKDREANANVRTKIAVLLSFLLFFSSALLADGIEIRADLDAGEEEEASANDDFVISLRSNHPGVRAKTPRTPRQLLMLASQQLTPR